MTSSEITRLLEELADGTIGAEDFAQIQNELRNNADVRRDYFKVLTLDHLLAERYGSKQQVLEHGLPQSKVSLMRRFTLKSHGIQLMVAAAAVVLGFFLLAMWNRNSGTSPVGLQASADCSYRIDGKVGGKAVGIGQTLVVERGVALLDLNPHTSARIEGPARMKVLDREGKVELAEGKGFFKVSKGGKGFEVHCPGGVIRDIGTKFGVSVTADGFTEAQVMEGLIEITDAAGGVHRVESGHAVKWGKSSGLSRIADPDAMKQTSSAQGLIFQDDFSEPDGTLLNGKPADVGGKWTASNIKVPYLSEAEPLKIADGTIDTSNGSRIMSVAFLKPTLDAKQTVYHLTLATEIPENIEDKRNDKGGQETITLLDDAGTPLVLLQAFGVNSHRWMMIDATRKKKSSLMTRNAFEKNRLTLVYESKTGKTTLFDADDPDHEELGSFVTTANRIPASLQISNSAGGDIAISGISMRVSDSLKKNPPEN